MKLESLTIRNFRCFGPEPTSIFFGTGVTSLVGGNGVGKTALLEALSRLFGIGQRQRAVRQRDFHLPSDNPELSDGASLSIDAVFGFPELDGLDEGAAEDAVPEYFRQMAASAPDAPLKVRIQLRATWRADDTPEGDIDEDIRWIQTLDEDFEWDECKRVAAPERSGIQLIYVPAARDAGSQVTALLKGRLWKAARWSQEFRETAANSAQSIQEGFEAEEPAQFVLQRLAKRWDEVNHADTDTRPTLRLIEHRFDELVRQAEFAFSPDEAGEDRPLDDLSDGQKSLFHIALTAATLEVEQDALAAAPADSPFDHEKMRRAYLTLLAVEEPENSLSPFFLSRIVTQARTIAALPTAQVALSSHSPAILSRIEPEEVRYFRLDRATRRSTVRPLTLPADDAEASQYVRLAVRAYPELYFARFVILGEGDSERLVIPRIADAMGITLDPSFVPIVPLAGRYTGHFWRLLSDLEIPFATLLDLDLGRKHGGANTIRNAVSNLGDIGRHLEDTLEVMLGDTDPAQLDDLDDEVLIGEDVEQGWFEALEELGVYFSYPLDLDFAMIRAFPDAYMVPHPGGRGPTDDAEAIKAKKQVTLKTGGTPALYDASFDQAFVWYPYLFLSRSKPETHIAALARIDPHSLAEDAPPELKRLVRQVKKALKFEDGDG